jgi:hypothetical protein
MCYQSVQAKISKKTYMLKVVKRMVLMQGRNCGNVAANLRHNDGIKYNLAILQRDFLGFCNDKVVSFQIDIVLVRLVDTPDLLVNDNLLEEPTNDIGIPVDQALRLVDWLLLGVLHVSPVGRVFGRPFMSTVSGVAVAAGDTSAGIRMGSFG